MVTLGNQSGNKAITMRIKGGKAGKNDLGVLSIAKGGIQWTRPYGKKPYPQINWKEFADLMHKQKSN